MLETILRKRSKSREELGIGGLTKVLYLYISSIVIYHIEGRHAICLDLITGDIILNHLITTIAYDTNLHPCALLAFQTTLSLF